MKFIKLLVIFFTSQSFAQLPKMPSVLNEFKVPSENNLIKGPHYFNFTSRSSVGANLQRIGIRNLITPPYFAYPFSATLFMFDKIVPVQRYDWYPSESEFTGEINRAIQSTLTIVPLNSDRGAVVSLELINTSDVTITVPLRWQLSVAIGKSALWEWSPTAALKASRQITMKAGNNMVSFSADSAALIIKCYGADFNYKDSSLQSTLKISPNEKITFGFSIVVDKNKNTAEAVSERIAENPASSIIATRNYWASLIHSWRDKFPKLTGVSGQLQSFYQKGILTALSCQWQVPEFILRPWYSTSGVDGGALNCYLWDMSYVSKLMAMADAPGLRKLIIAFAEAGIDKHYAINPSDGKGMGPLYSYNYYGYLRLIYNYILYSGDITILDKNVEGRSLLEYVFQFSLSKEDLSRPPKLINYGNNHNLLELKATDAYQYYTPSPNAERVLIYDMLNKLYQWKGLQPPTDLPLRSRQLKKVFIEQLWDSDKKWLFSLDEKLKRETAYSIQIFDVLRTGILNKEQERGIISHLNEQEFLSKYGVHSLSKRDEGYDPFDEDWGGPGVYAGDAPELVDDLVLAGFDKKGIDVLKRILWWGEFPYYPQAILAAKKGYRESGRANIIAGLNTTQCVITGLFGVRVEKDQLLIHPVKGSFINGAGITGLSIRGKMVDIKINKNGEDFIVKERNGRVNQFKREDTCILPLTSLKNEK